MGGTRKKKWGMTTTGKGETFLGEIIFQGADRKGGEGRNERAEAT